MADESLPAQHTSSIGTYWLESYDHEPPLARRRLTVISAASCGERTDFRWVHVDPPLEVGPHRWLAAKLVLDTVAIAPRHVGGTLASGPWPLHVYVCRAKTADTLLSTSFGADDISIEYWGTITPDVNGPMGPARPGEAPTRP